MEGRLKTTGTARYAAEHHDVGPNLAHGYILGAAIGKGRIAVSTPPGRWRRPVRTLS